MGQDLAILPYRGKPTFVVRARQSPNRAKGVDRTTPERGQDLAILPYKGDEV